MRSFLIFVLAVAVAIGGVGYLRGWFTVTNPSKGEVHVDRSKFSEDKKTFGKSVGEKAGALKTKVETLWKKSEGLTGDEKTHAQNELGELKAKHDRLEQQVKELEESGDDKFESIKQDLSKNLVEVESKIDELAKKLDVRKNK